MDHGSDQPPHHNHLHPQPDPTIQNISHRFSKLYATHKHTNISAPNPSSFKSSRNCTFTIPNDKTIITTTTDLVAAIPNVEPKVISKAGGQEQEEMKKSQLKKKKRNNSRSQQPQQEEGQRRRSSISSSSCSSIPHRQLGDLFSCTGVKVVAADMPPFMQIHAVHSSRKALDLHHTTSLDIRKFSSKTLALTLKKEFDEAYGPAWHCIVGTSFGSFVTHSVGGFMYFSMDHKIYILLFKTTVQRALEAQK